MNTKTVQKRSLNLQQQLQVLCRRREKDEMREAHLSNALRITDVNDFLAPAAECVLPLNGGALPEKVENAIAKLPAEPAGSVLTPIIPSQSVDVGVTRAKITVSDCLACSGCVTSAETILLSSESVDAFKKITVEKEAAKRFLVVGLSQQSVASIAEHVGMSLEEAGRRIAGFLKTRCHFDAVIDLSFTRQLALLEAAEEFLERYKAGVQLTITSACPGWVTYAEKTQGPEVLDCISNVRSPQGIFGALADKLRGPNDSRPLWVSSIMPCHDKKIEASRPDLTRLSDTGLSKKEVDCVLTTGELMDLMLENKYELKNGVDGEFVLDWSASNERKFGVNEASSSGGYAEFVLRRASRVLFGKELPAGPLITCKASRSGDLKTYVLRDDDGAEKLSFATAYGFRCLQSILRKVRRGECKYNYIELMACPGGCDNGGGQLATPSVNEEDGDFRSAKQRATEHLRRVDRRFSEAPSVIDPLGVQSVNSIYQKLLGGNPGSSKAKTQLRMEIEGRKTSSMSSLTW